MLTSNNDYKQIFIKSHLDPLNITLNVPGNTTCKELITFLAAKIKSDYGLDVDERDINIMHGELMDYGCTHINLETADEIDVKISKKFSSIIHFLFSVNNPRLLIMSPSQQKLAEKKDQELTNKEEIIEENPNENCILM